MSSLANEDRNDWQSRAACQGKNAPVFYPPVRTERKSTRIQRELQAKAICQTCPVRADCLHQALTYDERYGVWGGLTESERRDLRVT